jgi:hypothetical protein
VRDSRRVLREAALVRDCQSESRRARDIALGVADAID